MTDKQRPGDRQPAPGIAPAVATSEGFEGDGVRAFQALGVTGAAEGRGALAADVDGAAGTLAAPARWPLPGQVPHGKRKSPVRSPGRTPRTLKAGLTQAELGREADRLIRSQSNLMLAVVRMLYRYKVCTEEQLYWFVSQVVNLESGRRAAAPKRTPHIKFMDCVWDYHALGIVQQVVNDVADQLIEAGIEPRAEGARLRAFTLGPVGAHMAARIAPGCWEVPLSPYSSNGGELVPHDLIANEVLISLAQSLPGSVVRGVREVVVMQLEEGQARQVAAPDGAWYGPPRPGKAQGSVYLVEFENMRYGIHAEDKLKHYERIAQPTALNRRSWLESWETERMPGVLLVSRFGTCQDGYVEQLRARRARGQVRVRWSGVSLRDVLAGKVFDGVQLLNEEDVPVGIGVGSSGPVVGEA